MIEGTTAAQVPKGEAVDGGSQQPRSEKELAVIKEEMLTGECLTVQAGC